MFVRNNEHSQSHTQDGAGRTKNGSTKHLENVTRKRKIEDEACVQSKKACLENETCLEYLGGQNS